MYTYVLSNSFLKDDIVMRVVSGVKRGMKLLPPTDNMPVRPTADRVKESIFNLIQFDLGSSFLDLFAGSGQMGIEALSRGVDKVVFCDNNQDSVNLVKANLKRTGFEHSAEIYLCDYRKLLKTIGFRFDTIFIDPPYEKGLSVRALETIGCGLYDCLSESGKVIVECNNNEIIPEKVGNLIMSDKRKYGIAGVYVFSLSGAENPVDKGELR